MINKQTIISAYDEKLTLLQWLKLVNKALDEAVLTNVEINQRGNATFVFVFTFEDGTKVESNEIIVNKGDSVNGATIRNGHLFISLTNGDELDAGNLKPVTSFAIDASQHLIVNYGDGTSQDLGAIFSGNVNIDGTLNATKVTGNEIVENMSGYSFTMPTTSGVEIIYASIVKNGNKLTMVIFGAITPTSNINVDTATELGTFNLVDEVKSKIFWYQSGDLTYVTAEGQVPLTYSVANSINGQFYFRVNGQGNENVRVYNKAQLNAGTTYHFRIEQTFLLSDNMVGN